MLQDFPKSLDISSSNCLQIFSIQPSAVPHKHNLPKMGDLVLKTAALSPVQLKVCYVISEYYYLHVFRYVEYWN